VRTGNEERAFWVLVPFSPSIITDYLLTIYNTELKRARLAWLLVNEKMYNWSKCHFL
jgi:hypothetical protein